MEKLNVLSTDWGFGKLLAFRFFFVYFIIYVAPFPLGYFLFPWALLQPFYQLSTEANNALGPLLLGSFYQAPAFNTGSGDSSASYISMFMFAGLSFILAVVWSVVDNRRSHFKMLSGLNVLLRYYLAAQMLSYGFVKIFPSQFPSPSDAWLNQTYGESSPMRLLWTFMGYSSAYVIFTGCCEALGGVLLFFRRTRLLGACIVSMVMLHVVMLNFSYDVPVKLFSLHLLAIALFLMAPDVIRLMNLFVLNRAVAPEPLVTYFDKHRLKLATQLVKVGVILIFLLPPVSRGWVQYQEVRRYLSNAPQESVYGTYDVQTFILNNDTLPPADGDTRRWKGMMINARSIQVRSMDGVVIAWRCLGTKDHEKMTMVSSDGSTTGDFVSTLDGTLLTMEGILNENKIKIVARRKSNNSFLLRDRGFHWISEAPFNQ